MKVGLNVLLITITHYDVSTWNWWHFQGLWFEGQCQAEKPELAVVRWIWFLPYCFAVVYLSRVRQGCMWPSIFNVFMNVFHHGRPQTWARGHWKCCKVFCELIARPIYSKTLGRPIIYALFSQIFVGFAPRPSAGLPPWTPRGLSFPDPLICPPLEKKSCGCPWHFRHFIWKLCVVDVVYMFLSVVYFMRTIAFSFGLGSAKTLDCCFNFTAGITIA